MESLSYKIRKRQIEIISIPSIRDKEKLYLDYVSNHIDNVNKAWETMKKKDTCMKMIQKSTLPGKQTDETFDHFIEILDQQIQAHDASKYKDAEWDAYRKNFYPIDDSEKKDNQVDFDFAWKHHYENNMHHWDFWYHSGIVNEMTLAYIVEMCCDWIAMSMKFGGTADNWYENNKKKIHLGKAQEDFAVKLLKAYYA